MPQKSVACSSSSCRSEFQQNVDTTRPLRVDACRRCGAYGIMEMGNGFSLTQLPQPGVPRTSRWDCRMIERTLEGSTQYRALLVNSLESAGFDFIGFHGCGFKSACSMMRGGIDAKKNTNGARGEGFYVGSLHDGTPSTWATIAERNGQGLATILAVYVRKFSELAYGTDYDWGLMDGDDGVDKDGLEIVFRSDVCNRLYVVPAIDTNMSPLWEDCPHDSLSTNERPKVRRAATEMGLDYAKLAGWIMREELDENLNPDQMKILEKFS